jgi:hypothetical protein
MPGDYDAGRARSRRQDGFGPFRSGRIQTCRKRVASVACGILISHFCGKAMGVASRGPTRPSNAMGRDVRTRSGHSSASRGRSTSAAESGSEEASR